MASDANALIRRMESGQTDAILTGLRHKGALVRINGILNATRHSIKTDETIDLIRELKKDTISFDLYAVSDFATAALDLMGIEEYNGSKKQILNLIESKFDFG